MNYILDTNVISEAIAKQPNQEVLTSLKIIDLLQLVYRNRTR